MQYDYFPFFEYIISCDFVYLWQDFTKKEIIYETTKYQVESMWSPPKSRWSTNFGVTWNGVHIVHVVHLESNWRPPGIQVDFGQNLAGLSAKANPPGIYGGV